MASCITPAWASYAPQFRLTVNVSSNAAATATLSYSIEYVAPSPASTSGAGNRTISVTIDGKAIGPFTYAINGVTGTKAVASGTTVVNKGTSVRNVAFSISVPMNLTWGGKYGGTQSASGSVQISAKTSYTISYNLNGGSGSFGQQKRYAGDNAFRLHSHSPNRNGYSFNNWRSSTQNTTFAPGALYTYDASTTMTAQWTAHTYNIVYNANGGTGAPGTQTKTYGVNLTLSITKPDRPNYNFKGWSTSASSTTASYQPGGIYTTNAGITLYAVWELAYTAPRFSNISVYRCTSTGSPSDDGTLVTVGFHWETDKTVSLIRYEYRESSSSTWKYGLDDGSATGTSGTESRILGVKFNTELEYILRVTVTDSMGSNYFERTIPPMQFTVDFLAGGKGVAFGRPASIKGADFDMNVYLRSDKHFYREMSSGGHAEIVTGRYSSSYFGLADPNGDDSGWIRTPQSGILPYSNSSTDCNVGSAVWIFQGGYFRNVYVNNRNICQNKVLWSNSGVYMNGSQTATLSEAVSAQPTGIVIMFSPYSSGTGQNWDWHRFFIPKSHVANHNDQSMEFMMSNLWFDSFGSKLLYISDTKIRGHDGNQQGSTTAGSGVKYQNSMYVMRYVIGV